MREVLAGANDAQISDILAEAFPDGMPSLDTPTRVHLGPLRWLNAVLVVIVYQSIVVLPLLLLTLLTFWLLADFAVSPAVAATWIEGDGASSSSAAALAARSWLDDPWLRVPLFLTGFAVLERVVRICTEPGQRQLVFGPADAALRIRFAVASIADGQSREDRQAADPSIHHEGAAGESWVPGRPQGTDGRSTLSLR